jgi:hypothetical protein
MGISERARKIKCGGCPRLVKQTGNAVQTKGTNFGITDFGVDIGKFSNQIKRILVTQC